MYHIICVSTFNFNHCLVTGTSSSIHLLSESLFSNFGFVVGFFFLLEGTVFSCIFFAQVCIIKRKA